MKVDHIVIGDAHCRPGISNERFDWLGKFIRDYILEHPNTYVNVIEMGDFEDMESLSSYDFGKKDFEGRRYTEDLSCALDARGRVVKPLWTEIERISINRKKKPNNYKLHALGGNHCEGRISRIIQNNPHLAGFVDISNLGHRDFGFSYTPFSVPLLLNEISYVHYWKARGSAHPIGGGKNPAATILREKLCSSVTAHSHVLDRTSLMSGNGKRLYTLVAGCYLAEEQEEKYAGQSNMTWWKGICVLKNVVEGYPQDGEEFITIQSLKDKYK